MQLRFSTQVMSKVKLILFCILALNLLTVAYAKNQVLLIVANGTKGDLIKKCVSFDNKFITGSEVLNRAKLDFVITPSGSVCKIGNQGCPSSNCFCQCKGSSCTYWAYFQKPVGKKEWMYANTGPMSSEVRSGAVEGWIWTQGKPGKTKDQLPNLSFEDVCQ